MTYETNDGGKVRVVDDRFTLIKKKIHSEILFIPTHTLSHPYALTHARIHTLSHTYTYIHTYTHTHTYSRFRT